MYWCLFPGITIYCSSKLGFTIQYAVGKCVVCCLLAVVHYGQTEKIVACIRKGVEIMVSREVSNYEEDCRRREGI